MVQTETKTQLLVLTSFLINLFNYLDIGFIWETLIHAQMYNKGFFHSLIIHPLHITVAQSPPFILKGSVILSHFGSECSLCPRFCHLKISSVFFAAHLYSRGGIPENPRTRKCHTFNGTPSKVVFLSLEHPSTVQHQLRLPGFTPNQVTEESVTCSMLLLRYT